MFFYYPGRNPFPPPRGYLVNKQDPIVTSTDFGRWYQTVHEVYIEITLPPETVAKDLRVAIKTNQLNCKIKKGSKTLLKGKLYGKCKVNESIWNVDEQRILRVVLTKIITNVKDNTWDGLFKTEYMLDPDTAIKVRNRIDLERFQLELGESLKLSVLRQNG